LHAQGIKPLKEQYSAGYSESTVMFGDETEGKRADIPSSFAARPQVLGSEDWVENRRGKAETKLRFRMKR
jgi:hypothetical protein